MRILIAILLFPLLSFSQKTYNQAVLLVAEKEYAQAEVILNPLINKLPNHLKAIELLGDAYGYQENWDAAIEQYEKLVEAKPNTANYHYKYGGALGMKALSISKIRALGIIGTVKSSFLKAAELDPNHIDTRWALVELYMQLPGIIGGSKRKSLKYANELEALSKVDGYLAKGYIYEYDDEPELAEKYYKLAINEGGSVTCFNKLTSLYESTNKPKKAIANIETAHIKHKRNAMHYQIGKVCAEYNIQLAKGEYCLGVYIENYSAKDGVPKSWAYYRLAQINKHKNNKAEALKWIDMAIGGLPNIKVFETERQNILNL